MTRKRPLRVVDDLEGPLRCVRPFRAGCVVRGRIAYLQLWPLSSGIDGHRASGCLPAEHSTRCQGRCVRRSPVGPASRTAVFTRARLHPKTVQMMLPALSIPMPQDVGNETARPVDGSQGAHMVVRLGIVGVTTGGLDA